jgi:hypothetical protein
MRFRVSAILGVEAMKPLDPMPEETGLAVRFIIRCFLINCGLAFLGYQFGAGAVCAALCFIIAFSI